MREFVNDEVTLGGGGAGGRVILLRLESGSTKASQSLFIGLRHGWYGGGSRRLGGVGSWRFRLGQFSRHGGSTATK